MAGGNFGELDQGLNTAVKKLRVALEDSTENPRLIETIPRRGYCLIAPVEPAAGTGHRKELRRRLGLLFACISIVCVAFVVWLFATAGGTSNAELAPEPLTSYPGLEFHPSFSPDGSQVVFQWRRQPGEISDLYTKVIGRSGELRLTHASSNSFCPAWSPDGQSIAFLRRADDTRGDLFLISPLGGPERKLAELELPPYGSCPAWHSNGKSLLVSHRKPRGDSFPLFSMSIDTGEEFQLTFPPKEFPVDRDPAISPRGDVVVFARGPTTEPSLILTDLYLLPLSKGGAAKREPIRITFDRRTNAGPAWTPDERAIIFGAGPPHSPSLYELDFSLFSWRPRKIKRLAFAGDGVRNATISGNGRLAYSRSTIRAKRQTSVRRRLYIRPVWLRVLLPTVRLQEGAITRITYCI